TGQKLDCTFDLANGASKTVDRKSAVEGKVVPATVRNITTASAAGQPTDAAGQDSVDLHRWVSLEVDKVFQDASVNAGTSGHTFTVQVTNHGPSDAVGVHLTDTVDSRLTVSGFSDSGAGGVCAASTGQKLDCTFDLANGASKT